MKDHYWGDTHTVLDMKIKKTQMSSRQTFRFDFDGIVMNFRSSTN